MFSIFDLRSDVAAAALSGFVVSEEDVAWAKKMRMTCMTLHCTLQPHTAFYTSHFTLATPHSTLHTPHSTLYTVHLALRSTLYTSRLTLDAPQSTLHTPHSELGLKGGVASVLSVKCRSISVLRSSAETFPSSWGFGAAVRNGTKEAGPRRGSARLPRLPRLGGTQIPAAPLTLYALTTLHLSHLPLYGTLAYFHFYVVQLRFCFVGMC